MNAEKENPALEKIPANRQLIEQLYAHGKISREAREYALNFIHPRNQWGAWVSRLLLITGTALVLLGAAHFFIIHWEKIALSAKLFSLQFVIVVCVIGAYFYSLQRLSGQILLLSASLLAGVLITLFGWFYPTGAYSHQLYLLWLLSISGWTLISRFAAQWLLWLIIINMCFALWWKQAWQPGEETAMLRLVCIAGLNAVALALREYAVIKKSWRWPDAAWTRLLLAFAALVFMLIPVIDWIADADEFIAPGLIGLAGHGALYAFYRYKVPDIRVLAAALFCGSIIATVMCGKIISGVIASEFVYTLTLGLTTVSIFTVAVVYLRKVAYKLKLHHV